MMVPLLSLSMINYARPQIKSDGENIISKMWWMNYPVKYWKKCVAFIYVVGQRGCAGLRGGQPQQQPGGVEAGGQTHLRRGCQGCDDLLPMIRSWYIMTQFQIRLDNRMSLQLNSEATNLRITKLKLQDAGTILSCQFISRAFWIPFFLIPGNYTCEVEWAGDPIRVTHSLVVLQPPTINKPLIGNIDVNLTSWDWVSVTRQALSRQPGRVPHCGLWGLGWPPAPRVVEQGGGQESGEPRDKGGPRHTEPPGAGQGGHRGVRVSGEAMWWWAESEISVQARNSIGTAEANIHLHVHCEWTSHIRLTVCNILGFSDLPEVRPLSFRVYSGVGVTTELACRVQGYPEPMVSVTCRDHDNVMSRRSPGITWPGAGSRRWPMTRATCTGGRATSTSWPSSSWATRSWPTTAAGLRMRWATLGATSRSQAS